MTLALSGGEVVQMVIEAQKIGIGLYEYLVESTRSTQARNVFAWIAYEKKEHLRTLEHLSHSADGYCPDPEEYDKDFGAFLEGRVFTDERTCRQMAANVRDEKEAARLASNFEKEIVLFLYEIRCFVPEGQRDRVECLLDGEYRLLRRLHPLGQSTGP